jgi:DNA-binding NarL/FixJ family response regulator
VTWQGLIVDESPLIQVGIEAVLDALGIPVRASTQLGRDVIPVVAPHDVDLVVIGSPLDVTPEDLVARLRSVRDRPTRIVVLVSHPSRAQLVKLLHLGTDAIALRSLTVEELAGLLERVRAGERYVAPAVLPVLAGAFRVDDREDGRSSTTLTAREREVLAQLAQGRQAQEIADHLFIAVPTVKTHLSRIYAKLGATNRSEAIGRAVALGVLH